MTPASSPGLSRPDVLAYAAGSFGTGVFSTVPTVLLLYFCTEVLALGAGWAAALVFVPKVWAIVWDPLVGAWSDRTVSPIGRRRPFLIVGALGVAVAFVAVFTPPNLPPAGLLAWVGISYFSLATLYSLFAVPYVAIPAQIGDTPAERGRLVAWRMAVAMIGVLAGAGGAPLLVAAMDGGRPGYGAMALVIAAVCAAAMTGPIVMLRGRDRSAINDGRPRQRLFSQLATALRHRRFRLLIGAYMALLTGVSVVSAAIPYLVAKAFHRAEGDIGVAMCAMLAATILAVPAWSWAGRRWGETHALGLAGIAFVASSAALGLAAYGALAWPLALGLFALAGLPFAGLQVLPYTLVAHLIHEENRHGRGDEGVFTGVWTAVEKLGLAFGPALTGMALIFTQQDVAHGLALFVSVVPGLLALLSLPFLFAAARGPSPLPEFRA